MNELETKSSGIYMIKNIINNKMYIGSAVNLRKRIKAHISDLKRKAHHNKALQNAWNKYGEENFESIVLELVLNIDELLYKEQKWVNFYNSTTNLNGYNIRKEVHNNLGLKYENFTRTVPYSEERNKNVSIALKKYHQNNKVSKETGLKISNKLKGRISPMKGRKQSKESIIKCQQTKKEKGITISQEQLNKLIKSKYKKVFQYDLDFNLIKIWESIKSITNELGIERHNISRACKNKVKSKGYYWVYEKDAHIKEVAVS